MNKKINILEAQNEHLKSEYLKLDSCKRIGTEEFESETIVMQKENTSSAFKMKEERTVTNESEGVYYDLDDENIEKIQYLIQEDEKLNQIGNEDFTNVLSRNSLIDLLMLLHKSRNDLIDRLNSAEQDNATKMLELEERILTADTEYRLIVEKYEALLKSQKATKPPQNSTPKRDLNKSRDDDHNNSRESQRSEERYKQLVDLQTKLDDYKKKYEELSNENENIILENND